MAMRPIWSGSVSFGLVNIPIKLYLAAKSERFSFRMLHEKDQSPIQFKRFCAAEEKEVPYDEITRGYEYEKGQFVLVEDKDFDRIERAAAKTVDIQQFVDREEIPSVFFDTPYYLEPAKGAEKAYGLLRAALKKSNKVGIARVVLKEREYVGAVFVHGDVLTMTTMRYATEIREPEGLNIPGKEDLPPKQLELALMLVDQLSSKFKPEEYKDDYHEKVQKMLEEKLAGVPAPKHKAERPATGKVVDLVEILQQSLKGAKKQAEAEEPEEEAEAATGTRRATHHRVAARTARKKKAK